jgi:hypothetical protein
LLNFLLVGEAQHITKRGHCGSEQSSEAVHSLAPSRFGLESGNLLYLRQALASRVPSLLSQNLQALEVQVCVPFVQSHALLVVDWLGDMTLKLKRCLPHFRVLKSRRPRLTLDETGVTPRSKR